MAEMSCHAFEAGTPVNFKSDFGIVKTLPLLGRVAEPEIGSGEFAEATQERIEDDFNWVTIR